MGSKKRILFGTSNQAKIDHVRTLTIDWPVMILRPNELGLHVKVTEAGASAEENACLKAIAYARAAATPTFALDASLTIDQFAADKQPGVFVRRIYQNDDNVSDDDIILYYLAELVRIGGVSTGRWRVAVALALPDAVIKTKSYEVSTLFVAQASPVRIPDSPLSSLMLDPITNQYYSEIVLLSVLTHCCFVTHCTSFCRNSGRHECSTERLVTERKCSNPLDHCHPPKSAIFNANSSQERPNLFQDGDDGAS